MRTRLTSGIRLRDSQVSLPGCIACEERLSPAMGEAIFHGQELDVGKSRHVNDPEEAVVDQQSVLIEIVKSDQHENEDHPHSAVDVARAKHGPELSPCAHVTQREQSEPEEAQL